MELVGDYAITEILEPYSSINKRKVLRNDEVGEEPSKILADKINNKKIRPDTFNDGSFQEVISSPKSQHLNESDTLEGVDDMIYCKLNQKLKVSENKTKTFHTWNGTKMIFFKDHNFIDGRSVDERRLRFNEAEIVKNLILDLTKNQEVQVEKNSSSVKSSLEMKLNESSKPSDQKLVNDAKLEKHSLLRELFEFHNMYELAGEKPESRSDATLNLENYNGKEFMSQIFHPEEGYQKNASELNMKDVRREKVTPKFIITDEMLENIFRSSQSDEDEQPGPTPMATTSLSAGASKIVKTQASNDYSELISRIVKPELEAETKPVNGFNKENIPSKAFPIKRLNQPSEYRVKKSSIQLSLSEMNWFKPVPKPAEKNCDQGKTPMEPQLAKPANNERLDQMFRLNTTGKLNRIPEAASKPLKPVQVYTDIYNTSTSGSKMKPLLKTLPANSSIDFPDVVNSAREKKLEKLKDNKNLDYEEFCRVKFSD